MTNFLHWHKTTWALALWSAYIAAWMTVTGASPVIGALWWLAGTIVFSLLWLATRPLFAQPRAVRYLLARHAPGKPRIANLDPTDWATKPRRDAS